MTLFCFPAHQSPFEMGSTLKKKAFAPPPPPPPSHTQPFIVDPISVKGIITFRTLPALEDYKFPVASGFFFCNKMCCDERNLSLDICAVMRRSSQLMDSK